MDAWNPDQLKRMQLGGNGACNAFLGKYGVTKHTDIREKYNSQAAEFYREKIKAELNGQAYTPPSPAEARAAAPPRPPLPSSASGTLRRGEGSSGNVASRGMGAGWDSWDEPQESSGTGSGGRPGSRGMQRGMGKGQPGDAQGDLGAEAQLFTMWGWNNLRNCKALGHMGQHYRPGGARRHRKPWVPGW